MPLRVSRGWFSRMKDGVGTKERAVASAEARRLLPDDKVAFWEGYGGKTERNNIEVANVMSIGEFNSFLSRNPKFVQSSTKECTVVFHWHGVVFAIAQRIVHLVHAGMFENAPR